MLEFCQSTNKQTKYIITNKMIVKGFHVLVIPLGQCGLSRHEFFLKDHTENKVEAKGNGRTLFVGNCDFDNKTLTNDEIQELFEDIFGVFGAVESISISAFDSQSLTRNARFALVQFLKKSTLKTVLSPTSQSIFEEIGSTISDKWGIKLTKGSAAHFHSKYQYDYSNADEMSEEVGVYLREFEEKEDSDDLKRKRDENKDDEGFVKVQRLVISFYLTLNSSIY